MHVLVTGGGGMIGSHLVDQILAQGHEVVVVDNFITGRRQNLAHLEQHPKLCLVAHDMTEPAPPELRAKRFDRVYNLASPASPLGYRRYPIETHMVNAVGTLHALEIARAGGGRFLQASTSEIYGDPLVHPQVESYHGNVNPHGPRSCYNEGKRFAESLTMEFVRQFGLDGRIARIFNTYGPRSNPSDGRVVPNISVQALRNEPITIYGDGSHTRSFCYVADLVRGLMALMETDGLSGEVVNLGNPVEITIRTLIDVIVELIGSRSPFRHEPIPADDPTRRKPDIAKARQLLDWEPAVDLRDGLRATIDDLALSLTD